MAVDLDVFTERIVAETVEIIREAERERIRQWRRLNKEHTRQYSRRKYRKANPVAKGNYQAAKTHCKWGHPFDEANTKVRSDGGRECRACIQARQRNRALSEGQREANRQRNRLYREVNREAINERRSRSNAARRAAANATAVAA